MPVIDLDDDRFRTLVFGNLAQLQHRGETAYDRASKRAVFKSASDAGVLTSDGFVAGGLVIRARDTGRVLMIQRAHSDDDPASGYWEFPGGRPEDSAESVLEAARREWAEETGLPTPVGAPTATWETGKYRGHVVSIASENELPILDRAKGANPDDPDNEEPEAIAWWDPRELKSNPVIRPELREHPKRVRRAIEAAGPAQKQLTTGVFVKIQRAELLDPRSVDYRQAPVGALERCGTCVMYRPSSAADELGACTLVRGRIQADHVCDRWSSVSEKVLRRTVDLSGEEIWEDQAPQSPAPAGGGAMQQPPPPGGTLGTTPGGEPPRWDGASNQPRPDVDISEPHDDAQPDSGRVAAQRPHAAFPQGPQGMDGYWPAGESRTGQAAGQRLSGGSSSASPRGSARTEKKFNLSELRDSHGKWTRLSADDRAHGNAVLADFHPVKHSSDAEATEYLRQNKPRVSAESRDAVNRYTGDTFYKLNQALRAGDTSDPEVRRIDAAMRPSPADLIVTRHVNPDAFGLTDANFSQVTDLVGKKIRDEAYSSTALGSSHAGGLGGITMHIAVPKGTRMVNAAALSNNPHEREILLDRGLELAVSRVEKNDRYGYDLYGIVLLSGD